MSIASIAHEPYVGYDFSYIYIRDKFRRFKVRMACDQSRRQSLSPPSNKGRWESMARAVTPVRTLPLNVLCEPQMLT